MNLKYKRNMSRVDQVFRVFIGVVLIYIGPVSDVLTSDFLSSVLLSIVGALIIISSIFAFCPFYYIAGISTYKK